jgi:colicin import membrane protein
MSRKRLATLAALCLAALSLAAGGAQAQSLDEKLRAQLRTVMGQLRELQNSQATLEAEKAAAEQESAALKAKLAHGGGARPAASASLAPQAELDRQRAEIARLTEANQQAQAEIAKYKDAYTHVVETAQQTHGERDRFAQEASGATQALAACETKNIQLVKIGRDVLNAYAKVKVTDAIARGEPLLGLKRVKMERLAQEYGDKVYEAKFDPRAVKPAAPASAAAPPAAASNAAAAPQPTPATPPSTPR